MGISRTRTWMQLGLLLAVLSLGELLTAEFDPYLSPDHAASWQTAQRADSPPTVRTMAAINLALYDNIIGDAPRMPCLRAQALKLIEALPPAALTDGQDSLAPWRALLRGDMIALADFLQRVPEHRHAAALQVWLRREERPAVETAGHLQLAVWSVARAMGRPHYQVPTPVGAPAWAELLARVAGRLSAQAVAPAWEAAADAALAACGYVKPAEEIPTQRWLRRWRHLQEALGQPAHRQTVLPWAESFWVAALAAETTAHTTWRWQAFAEQGGSPRDFRLRHYLLAPLALQEDPLLARLAVLLMPRHGAEGDPAYTRDQMATLFAELAHPGPAADALQAALAAAVPEPVQLLEAPMGSEALRQARIGFFQELLPRWNELEHWTPAHLRLLGQVLAIDKWIAKAAPATAAAAAAAAAADPGSFPLVLLREHLGMDDSTGMPRYDTFDEPVVVGPLDFTKGKKADWPGVRSQHFWGWRYDGGLLIEKPGMYTLSLEVDDGAQLYLAERLCLDLRGVGAGRRRGTVQMELTAGLHPLRLDHVNGAFHAQLRFLWQPPGAEEEVLVPTTALRTPDGEPGLRGRYHEIEKRIPSLHNTLEIAARERILAAQPWRHDLGPDLAYDYSKSLFEHQKAADLYREVLRSRPGSIEIIIDALQLLALTPLHSEVVALAREQLPLVRPEQQEQIFLWAWGSAEKLGDHAFLADRLLTPAAIRSTVNPNLQRLSEVVDLVRIMPRYEGRLRQVWRFYDHPPFHWDVRAMLLWLELRYGAPGKSGGRERLAELAPALAVTEGSFEHRPGLNGHGIFALVQAARCLGYSQWMQEQIPEELPQGGKQPLKSSLARAAQGYLDLDNGYLIRPYWHFHGAAKSHGKSRPEAKWMVYEWCLRRMIGARNDDFVKRRAQVIDDPGLWSRFLVYLQGDLSREAFLAEVEALKLETELEREVRFCLALSAGREGRAQLEALTELRPYDPVARAAFGVLSRLHTNERLRNEKAAAEAEAAAEEAQQAERRRQRDAERRQRRAAGESETAPPAEPPPPTGF